MSAHEFIAALQFLTRFPLPRIDSAEPVGLAAAKPYFPAAGLAIGAMLAGLAWSTLQLAPQHAPWLPALVVVAAWIWITGALHLDGLGDVADAFGAAHGDPERFHAILKDPHAGSFAIVAICLQIMAKLVLLALIPAAILPVVLLLAPAWARWGILVWSATLPALKPGLAHAIAAAPFWSATVAWTAILAAASAFASPPLLAALAIVPLASLYWRWRLGGTTGDCLGASVEITETALLLAVVLVSA